MNPVVIQIIVLVLTFGAVFLLIEHVLNMVRVRQFTTNAVNLRLKLIHAGHDRDYIVNRLRKTQASDLDFLPPFLRIPARKVESVVSAARINIPARQVLLLMLAAICGIFAIFLFSAAFAGFGVTPGVVELGLCISIGAGAVLPILYLARRAQKLQQKIQQQFPVALDVFVRGLRAGHPIASALGLLASEMDDPIGSEFGLIVDEVSYGADLQTALQEFAARWDIEDIRMFVVCLSVQNETGGNLAEILDNLSKVIRDRASMYMKVRALSSEGRMTARMLTVLPVLTFLSMFAVNPAFYLEYARTPAFVIGFSVLIALYLGGMLWIRKLVDLRV